MSSNKHAKTREPSDADLKGNPGIGSSKGTTMSGEKPQLIEGETTAEGDVENDANPQGGLDPGHLGRTNR